MCNKFNKEIYKTEFIQEYNPKMSGNPNTMMTGAAALNEDASKSGVGTSCGVCGVFFAVGVGPHPTPPHML